MENFFEETLLFSVTFAEISVEEKDFVSLQKFKRLIVMGLFLNPSWAVCWEFYSQQPLSKNIDADENER